MIKFRCSGCQKAIGVNEKYAGRLIKCPSCQNPTRVPNSVTEEPPVAEAVPVAEPVTQQRAVEATTDYVPQVSQSNPICPSCQSELFNPSDTMCGICGHLLEQTPVAPQAPLAPRPASGSAGPGVAHIPPLGTPPTDAPQLTPMTAAPADPWGEPEYDLPVNPAVGGSQYSQPMAGPGSGYDPAYQHEYSQKSSKPSSGKSVGAWFAAVAIGMFLALIWGVIAAYTGPVGQVFAWAIGAIVGLVAGLIARSRSVPFCLATTGGALLCMLFGRFVSAWVIMLTVSAMATFNTFLIPDSGITIGVMEEMNAKGELEGEEKALADMRVEAFFGNKSVYEVPEYDLIDHEVEVSLDKKVRKVLKDMSREEKQALLKKVREDHPGWMEADWYKEAILDSMVETGEIEDEGLLAHAQSKLAAIDGEYDQDYYQDTPQRKMTQREEELDKLITKRFGEMDSEERKEAIRNARINHPVWTPVFHEYLAKLDAMYASGEIPKELKKRAKSIIKLNLELEYDDIYGDYDPDAEYDYEKEERESQQLQKLVNTELMKLSQDDIDALVESTTTKYPDWQPTTGDVALNDLSNELDNAIDSFESDGTFWSSLKTRFKLLDFVWLSLGMLSAFAIAFTLGRPVESNKGKNLAQ